MTSQAVESQGTVIAIGQGDAVTVTPGTDTFDDIGETKTWQGPGGSATVIDTTHLASTAKEKRMGLPDEGQFTFTMNRVFGETGQEAARSARASRQLRNIKVTYSDGTVGSFKAYVLNFSTSGGVDGVVEGSVTLEISGPYTEA